MNITYYRFFELVHHAIGIELFNSIEKGAKILSELEDCMLDCIPNASFLWFNCNLRPHAKDNHKKKREQTNRASPRQWKETDNNKTKATKQKRTSTISCQNRKNYRLGSRTIDQPIPNISPLGLHKAWQHRLMRTWFRDFCTYPHTRGQESRHVYCVGYLRSCRDELFCNKEQGIFPRGFFKYFI